MSTQRWRIVRLRTPSSAEIHALADLLIDCVAGGASIGFMSPLSRDQAVGFWQKISAAVAVGDRVLLVAQDDQGICGTVQLVLDQPDNQLHRADLVKMLVHRRARRHGLGAELMQAAETAAIEAGRSLLVLDTMTGSDAERLYARQGWQRVGDIPNYARFPGGALGSTTYYYRQLAQPQPASANTP